MSQQRDAFLTQIYNQAKHDNKVMILCPDFGAPALDKFRTEFPDQFVHCGISEQNAVNVAVGLTLSGKKVYLYAMAPFWLRAYEQLKLAAVMGVPLNVVAVGAGLSYAGSGPTHYPLEDIQAYRALPGVTLYTASTCNQTATIARETLFTDRFNIVRLERGEFPELYHESEPILDGYSLPAEMGEHPFLACGYLVHWLKARKLPVIDVYRQKTINPKLARELAQFDHVYTAEEQYGGFAAAITEALNEHGFKTRVFKRKLPERGIYENGTRDELLELLL